jgi:hypothetical protein
MKKLLRLFAGFLLLAAAIPAQASFTVVNKQGNFVSATSNTQTISIAAGHTVVVFLFGERATGIGIGAVTDSAGNTYTLGNTATAFGVSIVGTGCSLAIPTAITSVTYTPAGSGTGPVTGLIVWDITATGTISVASTGAAAYPGNAPGTANGVTTGNLAITSADGLLLGGANDGTMAGLVVGTGFTQDVSFNSAAMVGEHQAITASGPVTFTAPAANDQVYVAGIALQVSAPVVTNGVVMSNGHPVMSNGHVLYQ